jgi:hypothetical protein
MVNNWSSVLCDSHFEELFFQERLNRSTCFDPALSTKIEQQPMVMQVDNGSIRSSYNESARSPDANAYFGQWDSRTPSPKSPTNAAAMAHQSAPYNDM